MNTLKKAVLFTLGLVTFGFILFSFATIGLTVLSIAAVLVIVGFLARPLLPKVARKPVIIDVTAIHPHA
ncbi:MAG: hypothetical protein ACPGSM_01950 [Thiolinea sp.]